MHESILSKVTRICYYFDLHRVSARIVIVALVCALMRVCVCVCVCWYLCLCASFCWGCNMQMNQISCMCSPLHSYVCLCLFVYLHGTTQMQLYAPCTNTNARGHTHHCPPESRLTRFYGSIFFQ